MTTDRAKFTVLECFTNDAGDLGAVVVLIGYRIRVQLIDMDAEEVVGTQFFPLDLKDAAIAHAKRMVK